MILLPEIRNSSKPTFPLSKELSTSCDGLKSHSKTCDDLHSKNSWTKRLKTSLPHLSLTLPQTTTSSTSLMTWLTKSLTHPFTPSAHKSQSAKNSLIVCLNPSTCNRPSSCMKTKNTASTRHPLRPHTVPKTLFRLCPWTPNVQNTLPSTTTTIWPLPPANFIHVHTAIYVHLDTPSPNALNTHAHQADNTTDMTTDVHLTGLPSNA